MSNNNIEDKKGVVFITFLILLFLSIATFNYVIDPYYIFKSKTIKGINNLKIHKFSNGRTTLYSNVKLNTKNKDTIFTGNCLIYDNDKTPDNIAFFTIPITKSEEIKELITNLISSKPNIKRIFWGIFFDDFWNENNPEITDNITNNSNNFNSEDFINLFFSYNTTKYSIETLIASIKNKNRENEYIYPYREIAEKHYNRKFNIEELNILKETIDNAKSKDVNIQIYYSPVHITKKIDIYKKGQWNKYEELKIKLAQITPYLDCSLNNEYNTKPLDTNSKYYIDNIHANNLYNNIILDDLLHNKKYCYNVNAENVKEILAKDKKELEDYMSEHFDITNSIINLPENAKSIKIKLNN